MIERFPRALAPNSAAPVPNLATTSPDASNSAIRQNSLSITVKPNSRIRQSFLPRFRALLPVS